MRIEHIARRIRYDFSALLAGRAGPGRSQHDSDLPSTGQRESVQVNDVDQLLALRRMSSSVDWCISVLLCCCAGSDRGGGIKSTCERVLATVLRVLEESKSPAIEFASMQRSRESRTIGVYLYQRGDRGSAHGRKRYKIIFKYRQFGRRERSIRFGVAFGNYARAPNGDVSLLGVGRPFVVMYPAASGTCTVCVYAGENAPCRHVVQRSFK